MVEILRYETSEITLKCIPPFIQDLQNNVCFVVSAKEITIPFIPWIYFTIIFLDRSEVTLLHVILQIKLIHLN